MSDGETERADRRPPRHAPHIVTIILLLQGVAFAAVGASLGYWSGRGPRDFLSLRAGDLLVAGLLAEALIGSMQATVHAIPGFLEWTARQQQRLFPAGRPYDSAQIVLISASAGIGEEALFRGGLQTLLATHLPVLAAIAGASLLFVLLHLGSRAVSAIVFAYSMAFGLTFHFTGSLSGVMLAHALFDVWAIALVQRELVRRGMLED